MAWENIDEKLKKPFTVNVSFPAGIVRLPETHLTIDRWLESAAETDEEWRELDIRRIRFLENRWPMNRLVELEWDDQFANRRVILSMHVGDRAYILFSDWTDYLVIAALEPKDEPSLYRAVIGKLLENRSFVPASPAKIKNHRPDLVPEIELWAEDVDDEERPAEPPAAGQLSSIGRSTWKRFLSDVLVGWIGKWLNVPERGFSWHEEVPNSITREDKRAA